MLKYCFVKKFQLTAIREIEKFAQREIYKLIKKKLKSDQNFFI